MFKINFGPSSYSRSAPGVPYEDDIVEIPDGDLPFLGTSFLTGCNPERIKIDNYRDSRTGMVEVALDAVLFSLSQNDSHDEYLAYLVWVPHRNPASWVLLRVHEWTSGMMLIDRWFDGPYAIDHYCALKLLEAFGVIDRSLAFAITQTVLSHDRIEDLHSQVPLGLRKGTPSPAEISTMSPAVLEVIELITEAETNLIATWVHLCDREENGDFHIREVWKTLDVGPPRVCTDTYSRSAPLTWVEVKELLDLDDRSLEDALYSKIGVETREPLPGLPKGPYFDSPDIGRIRQSLSDALKFDV